MPLRLSLLLPLDLDTTDPAPALGLVRQLADADLLDHACLLHIGTGERALPQLEAVVLAHPQLPLFARSLAPDGQGTAPQIANYAAGEGYQLVVAQVKDRRAPQRWLERSHLPDLLASCDIPLLCLPERPVPPIRRILFATDLDPAAATNLAQLLPVARALGAGVVLARIITPDLWETTRQYQALKREFLEDLLLQDPKALPYITEAHHYLADELAPGVLACADDLQADLVVLSTRHHHPGWGGWWRSSLTADVLALTYLPVLVYHMPDQPD